MMTGSTILKGIVVVFATIGLIAVVGLLGMGLMHAGMMGVMNMGGMRQRMAATCSNMTGAVAAHT